MINLYSSINLKKNIKIKCLHLFLTTISINPLINSKIKYYLNLIIFSILYYFLKKILL